MGIWLLISAALAQDCPDLETEIAAAEAAAFVARLDKAETKLKSAEKALGCGEPASPELLARMWLVEGAWLTFSGDPDSAATSLQAARRVSPETWNPNYGDALKKAWEAESEEEGAGSLAISDASDAWATWVNGAEAALPVEVAPGLHALQVGVPEGGIRFGRVVLVSDGDELNLRTGLPAELPQPEPEPVVGGTDTVAPESAKKKSPALLVISGVAAAAAGGLAIGAVTQNGRMDDAATVDELNAAYNTQKVLGYTSYGLAGGAAVALGLHFAL